MDRETREYLLLHRLLERLPFPETDAWEPGEHRQAAFALMCLDRDERKKLFPTCPDAALAAEVAAPKTAPTHNAETNTAMGGEDAETDGQHTDVLILTPLIKEILPALVALGLDPFSREKANLEGYRIFRSTLELEGSKDTLALTVASISAQRNTPTALGTSDFIQYFQPREAVIMAGIGGGVKTKVNLGDVILAEHIIDVEGGRQQVGEVLPRYEHWDIPEPIIRHTNYYNPSRKHGASRRQALLKLAEMLRENGFDVPAKKTLGKCEFGFERGYVVAGEKLVADGSLPEYLRKLDNRIRACDMEGSGFAQACVKRNMQYLLFRGISDFGSPNKEDGWQALAAAFAMYDVKAFLQTQFRRKADVGTLI